MNKNSEVGVMEKHIELKVKEKKINAIEFALIMESIDFTIEDNIIYLSPLIKKKVIKKILKKYDFNLKKIDIDVIYPNFDKVSKMKNINALNNNKINNENI